MSKDLYDIVGDKIIEFCEKTYYSYIVFSFEQSYNGKEWTKEVEFATFYNGTNLCYESDWNEGQTHLRNLRIWHLEDSAPVVRCRECKWYRENEAYCVYWASIYVNADATPRYTPYDYCFRGVRKDEDDL